MGQANIEPSTPIPGRWGWVWAFKATSEKGAGSWHKAQQPVAAPQRHIVRERRLRWKAR